MPYFTHSYIHTAKSFGATLAPEGESFYELYKDNGLDYYCGDIKHPQPLGTFTSASTIYYALYPEEKYDAFTEKDQAYLDNLINTNVAYTNEGKQETTPTKADANKIKKVKIKTAIRKQASAKVSIKIKKVVGVKGYEVRFIAKRKIILKKDLRNNKSRFSIASKKIKAKKAVYVQVRAYVFADSKKTYGQWSRKKKITIKK